MRLVLEITKTEVDEIRRETYEDDTTMTDDQLMQDYLSVADLPQVDEVRISDDPTCDLCGAGGAVEGAGGVYLCPDCRTTNDQEYGPK